MFGNESMYDYRIRPYLENPLNARVHRLYPLKRCPYCGNGQLVYSGNRQALCPKCRRKVRFSTSLSDQIHLRNLLSCQARVYETEGKERKALKLLQEAEQIARQTIKKEKSLADLEMTAEIFFDQGEMYLELDQKEKALKKYREALFYREQAARKKESDVAYYFLAGCYDRIWKILHDLNYPEKEWKPVWREEIRALQKALEIADPFNVPFLTVFLRHERAEGQV